MWPNPLQYFLVPDIDVGENGMEGDSGDEEEVVVEEEGEDGDENGDDDDAE